MNLLVILSCINIIVLLFDAIELGIIKAQSDIIKSILKDKEEN